MTLAVTIHCDAAPFEAARALLAELPQLLASVGAKAKRGGR